MRPMNKETRMLVAAAAGLAVVWEQHARVVTMLGISEKTYLAAMILADLAVIVRMFILARRNCRSASSTSE
jgi:hypothetical protein